MSVLGCGRRAIAVLFLVFDVVADLAGDLRGARCLIFVAIFTIADVPISDFGLRNEKNRRQKAQGRRQQKPKPFILTAYCFLPSAFYLFSIRNLHSAIRNREGYRRLLKTFIANGIVLNAPIKKSVHPTALRWSSLSFPASSSATPAPSIPRVLAISPTSGNVSSIFFMPSPLFVADRYFNRLSPSDAHLAHLLPFLVCVVRSSNGGAELWHRRRGAYRRAGSQPSAGRARRSGDRLRRAASPSSNLPALRNSKIFRSARRCRGCG